MSIQKGIQPKHAIKNQYAAGINYFFSPNLYLISQAASHIHSIE